MKEITEDYVNFEIAKILKEKGFDITLCNTCYKYNGKFCNNRKSMSGVDNMICYPAPTLQMARKWLIENYNIHIEVRYFPMPNIYRYVIIHSPATFENIDSHPQYFNTDEEACEAAIKYCLTNLI